MAYIGNQPVPQATQTRDRFVATASQTSFATSGYTPGFLDVYLNGVKLDSTDYTATNGSDVVLAIGAASGDIVEVVAFSAFEAANALPPQTGNNGKYLTTDGSSSSWGTVDLSTKVSKTGDSMTGDLSFGDNDKAVFGAGSDLQIYHSGADSYISDSGQGSLYLTGSSSVNIGNQPLSEWMLRAIENGAVELYYDNAKKLATTSTGIDVTGTVTADGASLDGAVVINEAGADVDFRVESDTNTHALFLEGSSGNVGIRTANPTAQLHVYGPNFPLARIERHTSLTTGMRSTFSAIHTTSGNMTDGFGADVSFGIRDSAGVDNEIANFGAIRDGADNSGALVFATTLNGTQQGTPKMIIDSSGRVTKPYQPAFMAQRTGGSSNPGANAVYPFNTTYYNIGSGYNTSNYRFTAPVAGLYMFGVQLLTDNSGSRQIIYLRINGSTDYNNTQGYEGSADSEEYNNVQINALLKLNANDYVDVFSNSSHLYNSANGQNKFWGVLIA